MEANTGQIDLRAVHDCSARVEDSIVLMVDCTGEILFAPNPALLSIGTDSGSLTVHVADAERRSFSEWLHAFKETVHFSSIQVSIVGTDERRRTFDLSGVRCVLGPGTIGILLTGHERAFGDMFRLSASNRSESTATAVAVLKANLMGNIGHELRTPLNGIIGASAVLAASSTSRRQSEMIECIQDSAESLHNTLSCLTDYEAVSNGFWQFNENEFNLGKLIRTVTSEFKAEADSKGIELTTRVDRLIPGDLFGDVENLTQIIRVLLENAIRFTQQGVVSLQFHNRGVDDDSAAVVVEVFDTGIGIEEGAFSWICDPFRQVDSSCSRSHSGLGLGLALCQMIAVRLGTRLYFESSVGEGSRFWVPFRFGVCS